MSSRYRLFAALGIVLVPLATGCHPNQVVWLPDSSGFIYSADDGSGRISHYDVGSKKRKVIITDKEAAGVALPAISPDGKRVALCRCKSERSEARDETSGEIEIVIYDFIGKLVQRSKVERWGKSDPEKLEPQCVWLEWSPDGATIGGFAFGADTFLYDVKKDTIVRREGMPLQVGGFAFRPDGKGLLISGNAPEGLRFLDVSGKERAIKLPKLSDESQQAKLRELLSEVVTSSWKGEAVMLSRGSATLTIDTETLKATFDPTARKIVANEPKELRHELPLAGGARLRVLQFTDSAAFIDKAYYHIELFDPKTTEKARPILNFVHTDVGFCPSPDGKLMAIRYSPHRDGTKDRIAVINAKGEILSDEQVNEK
jgi:WD40 repeat protein